MALPMPLPPPVIMAVLSFAHIPLPLQACFFKVSVRSLFYFSLWAFVKLASNFPPCRSSQML